MTKWISVNKYLPPFQDKVLFYTPGDVDDCFVVGFLDRDGHFYFSHDREDIEGLLILDKITHWMPLYVPIIYP